MTKLIDLLIDTAATARLTRLVVNDEISRPAREYVEANLDPGSRLTYLVNCPYCVSVWAAFAVQFAPRWVVRALALSSLALGARWATDVAEGAVQ